MIRQVALWAAVAVLIVCGELPVIFMLAGSLHAGGAFSFSNYLHILGSRHEWRLFENSIILSALVSLLTLIVGVPLGIVFGKSDMPLRKFLSLVFCIPILVPPYVMAVGWSELVGRQGLMAKVLPLPASQALFHFVFGIGGTVLVLSTVYLPIPILLTMAFLKTINPRLEEAARLCTTWPAVLRRITIPLIRPGVVLSGILVFVLSLGEFSVPSYLRFKVFAAESFTEFSAVYEFGAATAASVPLALVALLLLFVEALYARRNASFTRGRGLVPGSKVLTISLGRLLRIFFWLTVCLALFLVFLPLFSLFSRSVAAGAYAEALDLGLDSMLRSFVYAFIGATFLTLTGFLSAYLIKNRSLWCWRLIDITSLFVFALPGTVLGIGLISMWNNSWTQFVYGSMIIIIFGYAGRYYVLSSRIILSDFHLIPSSMEEAAQMAGAGWLRRMLFVLAPLAKRGIFAAWLCVFLFCLRDTDITMLVYPPGCETLPVRIFTLMANGSPSLIAALCMLMVASVVIPSAILWHFQWNE